MKILKPFSQMSLNKFGILLFLIAAIHAEINSDENIKIGISPPYLQKNDVNTVFIHKQFVFELLSGYTSDRYLVELINPEYNESEKKYYANVINEIVKLQYDYLIYSKVYYFENKIFLKVTVRNVYSNQILLSMLYYLDDLNQIADFNSNSSKDFIEKFMQLSLKAISKKSVKNIDENKKKTINSIDKLYRHELFISNGFFKNNPSIKSYLNWYLGYCFTPLNIINIETAWFFGFGNQDFKLTLSEYQMDYFYTGFYAAAYLFVSIGLLEPNFGLRVEFNYSYPDNHYYITIPIDISLKIYLTAHDLIRINSSLQYNYYNINNSIWDKSYTIGIIIGYGRKL